MATKTITGVDGRTWLVSRSILWSQPATGDDFEHDVDGGRGAAFLILSSLFVFWLILIVWGSGSAHPHVPWYLWLVALVGIGFFPVRWLLRRPWTIKAETAGSYDLNAERWVGTVRGGSKAKEELRIITRRLRTQGTPGHADSPLQPAN
jgi:hypothetical protein